jgi:hypothetical protein
VRSSPERVSAAGLTRAALTASSCIIELAIADEVEEAEIEEMESRVYKIRPFGSAEKGRANVAKEKAGLAPADEDRLGVNMRDLGPAGAWRLRCNPACCSDGRYRQAGHCQGPCHPCHVHDPRHEAWCVSRNQQCLILPRASLLPVSSMLPHADGR